MRPSAIAAIGIPLVILGIYFISALKGFAVMNNQNAAIATHRAAEGFSVSQVVITSMRFTAVNFKALFPTFKNSNFIILLSFLFVVVVYILGATTAKTKEERRNMHLLFMLGISGSVFLALISIKSHHYTALYFRYYSFCIPFATLSMVYAIYIMLGYVQSARYAKAVLTLLVLMPALKLFLSIVHLNTGMQYNHYEVANKVTDVKADKLVVPDWKDAFLIQSFLPRGYKLTYNVDSTAKDFLLSVSGNTEVVHAVREWPGPKE